MNSTYVTTDRNRRCSAGLARLNSTSAVRALALLVTALTLVSSQAQQTVILANSTPNLYSAVGFSGVHTNGVTVTTRNDLSAITLNLSGLPSGASVSFSTNPIVPAATNNLVLNVQMIYGITNVAAGDYPLELTASGTAFTTVTQAITLHVGNLLIWSGTDTNTVAWSTAANWAPATAPASGANIKFQDDGVATNYVDSSITLGTLTYVPFGNITRETVIAPGVTVLVTNRFRTSTETDGNSKTPTLSISGTNGASLVVDTPGADVAFNNFNGGAGGRYDLSRLDNFRVTGRRFGIADVTLVTDGAYGVQGLNPFFFARTNVIRATFVAPFGGDHFTNSIQIWNNDQDFNNGASFTVNLGISNAFLADSFVLGKCRVAGGNSIMQFNSAFLTNLPIAYFRNANGGRMSFFGMGVDSGTNLVSSGSGGQANFQGTLDMQVDTMWLGHNRIGVNSNANARFRGFLTFTNGTVDVNTARLGYQETSGDGRCEGRITVNGQGTLIVNSLLELGHFTGQLTPPQGAQTFGQLVVSGANATARINTITAGVGSGATAPGNSITISGGGVLIVTNTIGAVDAKLSEFTINSGTLTLFVNGTSTIAYSTNLTTSGPATVNIASITGVGSSYPITVPIIAYENGSPSFSIGTVPAGFYPDLVVDNDNKVVNLVIKTNQGRSLIWRGNVNADWDTTTTNWVTSGLVATKYQDGDYVRFDDTLTGASSTNVTIASTLSVGQVGAPGVVVSNITRNYKFTGGGTLAGSANLVKLGSGSLTIDAGVTIENVVRVSGGSLLGAGNLTSTTLDPGTAFSFSGTIAGSFVSSNASATLLSGGTITGPVALRAGALTNLGTITGALTLGSGTYLTNGALINATVPWSVVTNSTLVNNGTITQTGSSGGGAGLNVNFGGTLSGTGTIDVASGVSPNDARVAVNNGGTFKIGNTDNEIATVNINTRLDLNPGSTNIIDVFDPATTNNDLVLVGTSGKVNWGDNNSGGTLRINNLGSSFTGATVLYPVTFANGINFPDGNALRPVVIPPPASGLAWGLSYIVTNGFLTVVGLPTMTAAVSGTNLTFSWPDDYRGWRLERQTNTLAVGLDPNSTNWVTVGGSIATNELIVPIIATNPCVFFRMAYP